MPGFVFLADLRLEARASGTRWRACLATLDDDRLGAEPSAAKGCSDRATSYTAANEYRTHVGDSSVRARDDGLTHIQRLPRRSLR